ncbi:hypothetical protein JCM8097_001199 [Rhodosporidiobolus ruineniae]
MADPPSSAPAPPSSSFQPASSSSLASLPHLKVVEIGDASTGKTALRQRWVSPDQPFREGYRATIGCDFLTRRWTSEGGDETGCTLAVWDTAGQERFRSLAPAFYRASHACVLVYSLTSTESPSTIASHIRGWFSDFRDKCPVPSTLDEEEDEDEGLRRFCWVAVGCKADEVDDRPGGERRAEQISDAVDAVLEELIPRLPLSSSASSPSRPLSRRASKAEPTHPPPTMKVEVLPPPSRERKKHVKPLAVDPTASAREATPPAESAAPPPKQDELPESSTFAAPAMSASASTSTTASTAETSSSLPPELDPPERTLDLLSSTSPPSPPPHFGTAGAPPAVWIGGLGDEERERDILDEAGEVKPDHRGEEQPPTRNYDPTSSPSLAVGAGKGKGRGLAAGADEAEVEPLPGWATPHGSAAPDEGKREEYAYERDGVKHFRRTSAKTGEGVEEVFDYLARRALYHLRQHQRALAASSAAAHGSNGGLSGHGVIKVNAYEKKGTGTKLREACCS